MPWAAARRAPSCPVERAAEAIARYGPPALVLSWVPVIGDAIVAAAGMARMPLWPFTAGTLAGEAARYFNGRVDGTHVVNASCVLPQRGYSLSAMASPVTRFLAVLIAFTLSAQAAGAGV